MSKKAFEKIKGGLDEAIIIAPYVAEIERLRAEVEKYKAIASKAIREQVDVRKDEHHYNKIKSWEEDGWGCTLDEALQMWSPGDVRELPPSGTVNLIKHALAEIKRIRAENEKLKLDFMQAVETELERHHLMLDRLRAENEGLKRVIEDNAKLVLHIRMEGEKLRAALKPFADVAENDICDSLTDADIFRPIAPEYSRTTVLCVGDLRAAAAALKETGDE